MCVTLHDTERDLILNENLLPIVEETSDHLQDHIQAGREGNFFDLSYAARLGGAPPLNENA